MDKGEQKTKVIRDIESKMDELDPESLRYKVLDGAREFKSSWIKLGQALYTVWKDKHFRGWGYAEFEVYTKKK
ncbi:MAG: hypothetical protein HQL30_06195 [Candidatus Omnitrophica bacterium]|nr:hypothetical protein [Candidatus Omnitrophota bacterium]